MKPFEIIVFSVILLCLGACGRQVRPWVEGLDLNSEWTYLVARHAEIQSPAADAPIRDLVLLLVDAAVAWPSSNGFVLGEGTLIAIPNGREAMQVTNSIVRSELPSNRGWVLSTVFPRKIQIYFLGFQQQTWWATNGLKTRVICLKATK
jgi:hypothetical protein